MRLVHKSENCIGCYACKLACQDVHNFSAKTGFMDLIEKERISDEGRLQVRYQMRVCKQCKDPVCVSACMKTAIVKNADGIVDIDPDLCIGCGRCIDACPHVSICLKQTGKGEKAYKCDLCSAYLEKERKQGRKRRPICVEACPLECICVE